LCQAAGRAGRDVLPGEVVIQTYHPEHYSITTAARGDYEAFYEQELSYRRLMQYPPVSHMLLALITSKQEEQAKKAAIHLGEALKLYYEQHEVSAQTIGPAPATLAKVNDTYRFVIYLKQDDYEELVRTKNYLEGYFLYSEHFSGCNLQFDFDPMSGY
jgi:primosomal protein N' (replication factor Y)